MTSLPLTRATVGADDPLPGPAEHQVVTMSRCTPTFARAARVSAAATLAVALLATGAGSTSTYAAVPGTAATTWELARAAKAGTTVDITSGALKVVSSTGHKLRLHVLAFRTSTGNQIVVDLQTRNQAEEHEWTFRAPESGVSVSGQGNGRIHLTSKRSAGYASVSLRITPHGGFSHTSCHAKTATRTRHVSLTGSVFFRTRSPGTRAWGNLGRAHSHVHFSTKGKVTWQKPADSNCSTPLFPCRTTLFWEASGPLSDDLEFFNSANQGAHAEIAGARFVTLAKPSGATRADIVSLPQPSPNQLVTGNPTKMQARFRGGTLTMSSDQPPIPETDPCGAGSKKKISVKYWEGSIEAAPTPIRIPAQIFGAFSTADIATALFATVRVKH